MIRIVLAVSVSDKEGGGAIFFPVDSPSDTSLMMGHIIIILLTLALGISIIKILNVGPGSLSGWCSGKHACGR